MKDHYGNEKDTPFNWRNESNYEGFAGCVITLFTLFTVIIGGLLIYILYKL
jgi:hypothetical protein